MSLVLIIIGSYLLASTVVLVFALSLCRIAKRADEQRDQLLALEHERLAAGAVSLARRPVSHRRRPSDPSAAPTRQSFRSDPAGRVTR